MFNNKGFIETISILAVAGMVAMMGICVGVVVWGGPKMMHMMQDEKSHEAKAVPVVKAIDPVCKQEVTVNNKTLKLERDGISYYFCSEEHLKEFVINPPTYLEKKNEHNH